MADKKRDVSFTIRFPDTSLLDRIRALAEIEGRSMQKQIIFMIKAFLKRAGK